MKIHKSFLAITLVTLGIMFRTVWHLGPNVEFVTAATLISVFYLGRIWAIIVPFAIMAISDIFIGNTNIFIFTWSAYLVLGYLSYLSNLGHLRGLAKILAATGLGISASIWFYLWTNFGVWLLDSWGMYPKTLSGLISCYIMAIPFLKYNLVGNLVFVPSTFILTEALYAYNHLFSGLTGMFGRLRKAFRL
jgi:hypothetical protein